MIHRRSIGFKELFDKLPPDIQAEAKERFKLLKDNPAHPQLHFKEFRDTGGGIHNPGTFSVRINANYRALGTEVRAKPQVIVWWFVGDHKSYMKMANSEKRYVPKKNLKEQLLFEMPKSINATEFNLDDPKVNRRIASRFKFQGELLEDDEGLQLIRMGNRIGYVDTTTEHLRLLYYVQWNEIFHKFVGHRAITQVAVWADAVDPRTAGLASRIFWEYLLTIHEVLMTDALQTPDGQRFWRNRVSEAFDHQLRVYYLNLLPSKEGGERELIEIRSKSEFERLAREKEFWGRDDLHQARKIIISDKDLQVS